MSLSKDVRHLSEVPIFSHLEPEALRLLAFSAESVTLKNGEVLFEAGDVADCAYVVLTGALILRLGDNKDDQLALPTSILGETALTIITTRPAQAIAAEASTLLKISQSTFRRVLSEYPDCAVNVRRYLATNLVNFVQDLEKVRLKSFANS